MTYTPAQVNAWYQSVQFRDGPTSTVTSYVSLLNSGLMQPVDVQTAIINDTYTAANVNPVIRLYQAAFNRVPDQAGQNAWADALGGTPDAQKPAVVQQLATDFANSPEFFSNYGVRAADPINSAVLTAFYQNVLNRAPDAAGYAFWLSSGLNVGQVLNSFAQSAEFVKNSDNSIVLYQQAEIAGNYATSGSLFQYGGYPGTTYILTTGIDATGSGAFVNGQPTGNSNIIGSYNNGSASTFNSGDQIAATGTGNTLSLTDGGGSSGAGGSTGNINSVAASVSGVQTLTVTSGEAIAFNGVTGTGGYTGLTQINATTASVGGNTAATPTSITAAATTNVTVTDTAAMGASANAFGGGVTVNGGKNISITEKGATTTASTIKVGGTTSTNPAGTVNVTVNAVSTSSPGNTKIAVDGGTSVSVTQGQTGTVVIGSATAPTGAVTVVDTGGTGDVNVLGGASATITETTLSAGYKAGQVLVSGVTGATTLTVSSTNTVAANSAATAISATNPTLSVTGGTGATIATTGANNYTSTAINAGYIYAGTADNSTITPIAGNISITDTFAGPGKDVISAFGTGSVTINSTRTSGTITVGNSTRANDPTGAVSITSLTNSGAVGAPNYYGTGNVAVNVNGSTTVSITGGKASSSSASYVTDRALTNALSTVSVTGFQGTTTNVLTINSTALSTLNISDNRAYNPLKVANANTAVVVSNSTVDHTLAINLQGNNNKASNGTGTGTFVQDSNAKVVNVTATGLTENYLQLVANDATSGVAQTFSFTNNSAGKLTITGLTAGSTGSPTNTVTVAGTGAVNLGDVTGWGTAPTSITSTNTGGVTVALSGQSTSFSGGTTGNNTVTVSSTGTITKAINAGTGGNNTVVFNAVNSAYAAAPGAGITNFQNVQLAYGASSTIATSSTFYDASPFGGVMTFNQLQTPGSSTSQASAAFTNVASNESVVIKNSVASYTAQTLTTAGTVSVDATVNGVGYTASTGASTTADARALFQALTGVTATGAVSATALLKNPGVSVAISSSNQLIFTGADTASVAYGSGGTITTNTALTGINKVVFNATDAAATGTILNLSLNTADNTNAVVSTAEFANAQTVSVNSVSNGHSSTNSVNLYDVTASSATNQATTINISGGADVTVAYARNASGVTPPASSVATINASGSTGKVNTAGIQGSTAGLTITGGAGQLTASGSGYAAGQTASNFYNATDSITTGSGGGVITLGSAGSFSGAGTSSVNFAASTAKGDVLKVNSTTSSLTGQVASVTGFSNLNSSLADALNFSGSESVIKTTLTGGSMASLGGGSDTFVIKNGVITFTGADTLTQLLNNARILVNGATYGGANYIASFVSGGNTYVVGSGSSTTVGNDDIQLTFNGMSVTNFGGITGSADSLLVTSGGTLTQAANTAITSHTSATTVDATGYQAQAISGSDTGSVTVNHLAASATINDSSTGNYALTVTQDGTAANNSLQVNLSGAHTLSTLSADGLGSITINPTAASTITTLVNPSNVLTTVNIAGTAAFTLGAITDTALTTINITDTANVTLGSSGSPLSQNGLTVNVGTSTAPVTTNNSIYLSGNNVVVNAYDNHVATSTSVTGATGTSFTVTSTDGFVVGDTVSIGGASATVAGITSGTVFTTTASVTLGTGTLLVTPNDIISATGTGATINALSTGLYTITTGANATVTLGQGTQYANGDANANGNHQANSITVGANSIVTLGTDAYGVAYDGGSTITVFGNTVGSSVAPSYTTVNNIVDNATKLDLWSGAVETSYGFVNVASATSLSDAFNLAATQISGAGSKYVGWFQFAGDSYVLGTNTASETAIGSNDILVKLAGLQDLSNFAVSSGVVLL